MKPWDDTTVLAKKGVSLTVLQHWLPGKERLLTILDSGGVKKPPSSQTVLGLPLLVANLAALTPCQVSTAAVVIPGNRVGTGVRNCLGSCLHQPGEHHTSFTREQGATLAPRADAAIPLLFLPMWERNSSQPAQLVLGSFFWKSALFLLLIQQKLFFFLSCPTLEELGIYRPAKGWAANVARRCPWKGRETRGWSCAYWKRRHRKERGRTDGTHKHKAKKSPRVTEPLPHLSDSSAML